jgi:hypothetical protein
MEGPPGGAVAYTHFGARLARPGRFDSCTLYQFFAPVIQRTRIVGLHPTDAGFNSRTAHQAVLARRSSPRSIIARCWFDSNIRHQVCIEFMGDWQRWLMHSPFKRDEAGSIPASRTKASKKRRHSITDECAELLPRTMRVQISLPLPMWGCGPTDEGARLRTLRSEFNSLHPYQI